MKPVTRRRILFVFPGPELGGAERQGMHLARYLKRRGCSVHVWSTFPGEGRVVEECAAEGIAWTAHRFLWPCRKSSLVRDGWRLFRALRKLRPDVILSYTTSPNVGCGLFWRFTPAKVCIWGQRNMHCLSGDIIERLAFHQVSAVVCNAAHEVEYLKKTLGKSNVPIIVINNGIAIPPATKTRTEWRSELGIGEDVVVVTMVANFRLQKDHPVLLRAWRKILDDWPKNLPYPRLLLAGAPMLTYDAVYQLATDLKLLGTVNFIGQVMDISGLLEASDIGTLASTQEGLSNAILEYMASGLPVVATDLSGNREALGIQNEQSFCKRKDPLSLAERLQMYLDDPDLRRKIGKLNKERADEYFSIQAMCDKTVRILSNFLRTEI